VSHLVLRLSELCQQRVRLAAGMLDIALGAVGIAVLCLQLGDPKHAHPWAPVGGAVDLGAGRHPAAEGGAGRSSKLTSLHEMSNLTEYRQDARHAKVEIGTEVLVMVTTSFPDLRRYQCCEPSWRNFEFSKPV
jgi:hypothetical protein